LRGSLKAGVMWYSLEVVSEHCWRGWVWGCWGSGNGVQGSAGIIGGLGAGFGAGAFWSRPGGVLKSWEFEG